MLSCITSGCPWSKGVFVGMFGSIHNSADNVWLSLVQRRVYRDVWKYSQLSCCTTSQVICCKTCNCRHCNSNRIHEFICSLSSRLRWGLTRVATIGLLAWLIRRFDIGKAAAEMDQTSIQNPDVLVQMRTTNCKPRYQKKQQLKPNSHHLTRNHNARNKSIGTNAGKGLRNQTFMTLATQPPIEQAPHAPDHRRLRSEGDTIFASSEVRSGMIAASQSFQIHVRRNMNNSP